MNKKVNFFGAKKRKEGKQEPYIFPTVIILLYYKFKKSDAGKFLFLANTPEIGKKNAFH